MILTYHGKACVKLTLGDLVVVFNPQGKNNVLKSRFGADIALVSLSDSDYNGVDQVVYGDRSPFIADGPGEYETNGIFCRGFQTKGPDGKVNTIYSLSLDDISVGHLGALSSPEIPAEALEAFGEIDILLVPVFDSKNLSHQEMTKLVTRLNPKVIIPLWTEDGKENELGAFLKEAGEEKGEMLDKYTVRRKDVEALEGEMVLVKSF